MTYKLRRAIRSDETVIRALVRAAHINPIGLDWQRFVVAVSSAGEVIGCGQIKPHRDGSLELASLVVAPGWRRQGIARDILEFLVESTPEELHLMCQSRLGPLYEKFGFRAIGPNEMPRFFRRVSRLAGLADFLLEEGDTLLVMKRSARG
jgi:N-acetylglutamate synthase-like GNAT family acetyltransferase